MDHPELNPYAAPTTPGEIVPVSDDVLSGRLRMTAIGLKLIYGGLLVLLLAWIGTIAVSMLGLNLGGAVLIFGIVSLIALVVINVGPFLCLTVPGGYGLRAFAMATVVAQVCGMASFVASYFVVAIAFSFAALGLALVTASMFLMFLYRLSVLLGRPDLVQRSRNVGVLGAVVVFGVFPASWFVTVVDTNVQVGIVLAIGVIAGTVLALVMYANLVNAIASAISK